MKGVEEKGNAVDEGSGGKRRRVGGKRGEKRKEGRGWITERVE